MAAHAHSVDMAGSLSEKRDIKVRAHVLDCWPRPSNLNLFVVNQAIRM